MGAKRHENIMTGQADPSVPHSSSAFTMAGNVVLAAVRDTIQNNGRENLNNLIEANKEVKAGLKN